MSVRDFSKTSYRTQTFEK